MKGCFETRTSFQLWLLTTAYSNPILLFLYSSLLDQIQCVTGFEDVHAPDIASDFWFQSTGLYVFTEIEFECNGSIQGVRGIAYFATQLNYNRTLVLNLNLWRRLNQNTYIPTVSRNATFSLESIASGSDSATSSFYFNMSRDYTFSIDLADAPIDVMTGDILGIYLPPETTYESSTIINHIPIRGADDFPISYFFVSPACWSPTLGRVVCNLLLILQSSNWAPVLSLNVVPTSVPTGKLILHTSILGDALHHPCIMLVFAENIFSTLLFMLQYENCFCARSYIQSLLLSVHCPLYNILSLNSIYQSIPISIPVPISIPILYCGARVPRMCGRHTGVSFCRETGHLQCCHSCVCHPGGHVSSCPVHHHCPCAVGGEVEQTACQRQRYST